MQSAQSVQTGMAMGEYVSVCEDESAIPVLFLGTIVEQHGGRELLVFTWNRNLVLSPEPSIWQPPFFLRKTLYHDTDL